MYQRYFPYILVILILLLASIICCKMRLSKQYESRKIFVDEIYLRIKAWWFITILFFAALFSGFIGTVTFFFLVSLLALREYVALIPTVPEDRRTLLWSFFLLAPTQYYFITIGWYGMYSIFIPVWAFLFIPTSIVLTGNCDRFLERTAKIQWGLMACVFLLSHTAALRTLNIPGFEDRLDLLVLYLVLVTEMSDIFQFIAGKSFGRRKIAPNVSPNKTWAGVIGGVIGSFILGAALSFWTPFSVIQSALVAVAISIVGVCGGLTMSAIKRDRGIKDYGTLLSGHGGVMDRIDSLCYTAPAFFHTLRYYWSV